MGQRTNRSAKNRRRPGSSTPRHHPKPPKPNRRQTAEAAAAPEQRPSARAETGLVQAGLDARGEAGSEVQVESDVKASRDGFRPEIEGLRGLAVLLVVLFHGGIAGIPGGFIGVDVFFVISGFLITGLLLREREQTGSIDLLRFYARRARRILPAAVVVIAVVLPIAVIVVGPLSRAAVIADGLASALSIGNIRFAVTAGDYFSSASGPSPFLHFWSLGVEEQFYLGWPLLLILAARTSRPRLGVAIVMGAVVAGSLVASLIVTHEAVNWAFYSLPTRAWQLGIGGLLAVAMVAREARLPQETVGATAGVAVTTAAATALAAATTEVKGTKEAKRARKGKAAMPSTPQAMRSTRAARRRAARSSEPVQAPASRRPAPMGPVAARPALGLAWISARLLAGRSLRAPAGLLALAGWLGLAAVIWSAVFLDSSVAYPGPYALAPTLGAAGLIAAGAARRGPGRVLSLPPMRFLGRISYSLYLWHWPLLVLPALALGTGALGAGAALGPGLGADGAAAGTIGSELALPIRLGLIGLSVLLATITCLAIEEPFRHSLALSQQPRRTLSLGFASVLTLVIVASALNIGTNDRFEDPTIADSTGSSSPVAVVLPDEAIDTAADDAAAIDEDPTWPLVVDTDGSADGPPPVIEPIESTAPSTPDPSTPGKSDGSDGSKGRVTPTHGGGTSSAPRPPTGSTSTSGNGGGANALPRDVKPTLANAHDDRERLWTDGCLAYENTTVPKSCVYGDATGSFTIALVGDSHGAQWFPAFQRVAKLNHWRLLVYAKVSCPFIDMAVKSNTLKREYSECATWNAAVVDKLARVRPNLTVVAMSHWILPLRSADATVAAQGAAMAREIALVPGRTVILVDTPHAAWDVPDCLASHRSDIRACATPRSSAFSGHGAIERAAAKIAGVARIDLASSICPGSTSKCPAVVNGMIVFRDFHHLTETFVSSLAPNLDRALGKVIPGG